MKKILAFQWSWVFFVLILLTSCLEDNDEIKPSSAVSITSFSIENIETQVKTQTSAGKDTILTLTIDGSLYPFAIDHVNGQIYNPDSLPLGTDVSKVVTNINSDAYYMVYGDENKYYSAGDSIDFTKPVKFTAYAYDEISYKTYYVRLNVHQFNPDSLFWQKISESNFQGTSVTASQKALLLNKQIYVFMEQEDRLMLTQTSQNDGKIWTEPIFCEGISGKPKCQSIVVFCEKFYLIANGVLYQSIDGIQWATIESKINIEQMIAATDDSIYVLQGNDILSGVGDGNWFKVQSIDKTKFPKDPIAIQTPLITNPTIQRTTLIGVPEEGERSYASVWSKLDREKEWTYYNVIEKNMQACPPLNKLAVIYYDNAFFAFGGKSLNSSESEIEAFENIYVSRDGGITWWTTEEHLSLPQELKGFEGEFSYVVDDYNYIWLMCSGTNTIFKGRINRLIKE